MTEAGEPIQVAGIAGGTLVPEVKLPSIPSRRPHPQSEQEPQPPGVEDTAQPSSEVSTNPYAQFDKEPKVNVYQQFDTEPDAGDPGLKERARLNLSHSYWTGTTMGASELKNLHSVYTTGKNILGIEQSEESKKAQNERYEGAVTDLIRYGQMQPWSTTMEAAAAFGGALVGGMLTPEAILGWSARGANWLARTAWVGAQQSLINVATDIPIQHLNIASEVQKEFDWHQTLMAGTISFVIGGGLHFATGELLPKALSRWLARDHATDDPSLRRPGFEPLSRQGPEIPAIDIGLPQRMRPDLIEGTFTAIDDARGVGFSEEFMRNALGWARDNQRPDLVNRALDLSRKWGNEDFTAELEQAARRPAPVEAPEAPVLPEQATPNIHRVTTPAGQHVEVQPVVMEARDLITSSDAGYDPALQPRDRSRIASQQQVREIAANLDPERLGFSTEAGFGAPIIGPDKMVESGNARVMAIRQAYLEHPERAQAYRDWIAKQGLDVSGFEQPVVVRQRTTVMTPEERQAFTVGANQQGVLGMGAGERALVDARSITIDDLAKVTVPDNLAAPGNRDFVRAFIGKLPVNEQGPMLTPEGGPTSEAITRIRNAIVAKAYGDAPVLTRISESVDDEVKGISNALVAAAPDWAKLRADVDAGLVRADVEQTGALMEAVSRTADLRATGQKLADFLTQEDPFAKENWPIVQDFMRLFYDPAGRRAASSQRITDALKIYTEEARKVSTQALDLGMAPVTAEEVQRVARERAFGQGVRTAAEVPAGGRVGAGAGAEAVGLPGGGPGLVEPGLAPGAVGAPGYPGRPGGPPPGAPQAEPALLAARAPRTYRGDILLEDGTNATIHAAEGGFVIRIPDGRTAGPVAFGGKVFKGSDFVQTRSDDLGYARVTTYGFKAPPGLEQDYVGQAMRSLAASSRTAKGTIDISSTPGKGEKMVGGLTPTETADTAKRNFEGVVRDLFQRRNEPIDAAGAARLIDETAEKINRGLVKEGELQRTADSTKFPYTKVENLPAAKQQFADEFARRWNDPAQDPIEFAAWIEWRLNMADHFWADGAGKTSRAVAALPLMRAGLPIPAPERKAYFDAVQGERTPHDPAKPETYGGPVWDKFNEFYHSLFPEPEVQALRTAQRLRREGPTLLDQREAEGQLRMAETPGLTLKEKLEAEAQRPLTGGEAGPREGGLFDTGARDQGELFAPTKVAGAGSLFLRAPRVRPGVEAPRPPEAPFMEPPRTAMEPEVPSPTPARPEGPEVPGEFKVPAGSKEELKELIRTEAPTEEINAHPLVQDAIRAAESEPRTNKVPGYGTPEHQANRVFIFDRTKENPAGVQVIGYEAAIQRFVERARRYGEGPVGNDARAILIIGPPASGKSTQAEQIARRFGYAIIDPDDVKVALPEYKGGIGAGAVHEESSDIAKLVAKRLLHDETNIVVPKVGDNAAKLEANIRELQGQGYTVDLVYVHATPESAYRRMINRFLDTGRIIEKSYFDAVGTKPQDTYIKLKGIVNDTAEINADITGTASLTEASGKFTDPQALRLGFGLGQPVPGGARGGGAREAGAPEAQALAQRKGGEALPGERVRPAAGIPEPLSPQQATAIRSLQQQSFDLADAIGFPLREGRQARGTLGQFKPGEGVARVKEVPDFEVVAHEAGHAIESKVGQSLKNLIQQFDHELAPLVTDPTQYPRNQHAREGFAEYIRRSFGNPAEMQKEAPGFTTALRQLLERDAPDVAAALDNAGAAYRAYQDAPSVNAVGAVRRSRSELPRSTWERVVKQIQDEGFFPSIKLMMQHGYTWFSDANAPMGRAVRDMVTMIRDQQGGRMVDLKSADNPDVLLRLFARSEQAGLLDLVDGVRPHHDVTPRGPSLASAIAKAIGAPSWLGRWESEGVAQFGSYLIARRAEYLWRKYRAGQLQNPPAAFSRGDAMQAMADLERVNPTFREASDMVHGYTRELLRKQYDGGLITRELYDKLVQEEFYVPFMRDLSDRPTKGGGFGSVAAMGERVAETVKRMRGSSRDIVDPLESLMTQTYLVNRALKHNDVILALKRMAAEAGPGGGRFFEDIPATEAKQYTFDMREAIVREAAKRGVPPDDIAVLASAVTDVFGKDPLVGSFWRAEGAGTRGEPIVFYKEAGETKAARIMHGQEGHALYELLTSMPTGLQDVSLQMLSVASSTLRSGVVTNPVYVLTNYIRDQVAVGILRSDYIPFISGVKGIYSEVTQGEAARLYGYAGGVSAGAAIAPLKQAAEADLNALAKQGYLINRTSSIHGMLELAQITEAGTRNSVFQKVYEASQRAGLSKYEAMIEAAWQATDSSLNFGQRGSGTMAMVALTPFVNAWQVGMTKLNNTVVVPLWRKATGSQATTQDIAEFRNALLSLSKMAGVGAALGAAWAALQKDSDVYADTSPELKGTHFVWAQGKKVIVMPKPFELSIGFTAGEFAYQRLMRGDPRAAEQFAEAAWEVLKPPVPVLGNPFIKTGYEVWANKSTFTGRPLVPERLQGLSPAEQVGPRTSTPAKWIGQQIGVSPIKVDHAIGGLFGTWGRDMAALATQADPDSPAAQWEDMVFLRRFVKDPRRSSDITKQFWNYMGRTTGKFNQARADFDDKVKGFGDAAALEYLNQLPENQRAYVTLQSAADQDGKPSFNADIKRLHPLTRAYNAVTTLTALQEEMQKNTFRLFETGEHLTLDPTTRRDVLDNVRELSQKEMRNALVILKEPGYTGRPLLETKITLDKIRSLSPQVADEIAARYQTNKIYTTTGVARAWPRLKTEVLRDGSQADVADLAYDVKGDGYEFEAEAGPRVKKPQKRRIPIPAQR